jgi:hypothetical protein
MFSSLSCGDMEWIDLPEERDRWRTFVKTLMNFQVPENVKNFLISLKPVKFSGRTLLHGVSK